MDSHRNGDVGTVVDRGQERQDGDVALDEHVGASRMQVSCGPMPASFRVAAAPGRPQHPTPETIWSRPVALEA